MANYFLSWHLPLPHYYSSPLKLMVQRIADHVILSPSSLMAPFLLRDTPNPLRVSDLFHLSFPLKGSHTSWNFPAMWVIVLHGAATPMITQRFHWSHTFSTVPFSHILKTQFSSRLHLNPYTSTDLDDISWWCDEFYTEESRMVRWYLIVVSARLGREKALSKKCFHWK